MGGCILFLDMVGHWMKDSCEEHFEFAHRNVSSKDVNEGNSEYAKFEKVGLKNRVNLSHNIIFQHAHQWLDFA